MGKYSRDKGKRGERGWASFCREEGYSSVRRTAQFCGRTGDSSDCVGLPGIHQEVKFVEHLNIREAYRQAEHDALAAKKGDLPIVAHKRSNDIWMVTMRAEDWFKIYREWEAGRKA